MARPAASAVVPAAATALPLAVSAVLVFRSGGYYPTGFGFAALVLLVAAATAAIAIAGSWTFGGVVALCGLLGLSVWQLFEAAHADDASLAQQAATLSALYAAAGALTLFGMRRSWLPRLVDGALLVSVAAALGGLLARLFPSFGSDTEARLAWPLTYWNGLGAAAGFGIVLAIGIAGATARPLLVRGLAAAAVPPMLLTLVMTFSRGGALVAFVGLAVALALAPGRIETVAAIAACAGPAAVLVWLATRAGRARADLGPARAARCGGSPDRAGRSRSGIHRRRPRCSGCEDGGLDPAEQPARERRRDRDRRRRRCRRGARDPLTGRWLSASDLEEGARVHPASTAPGLAYQCLPHAPAEPAAGASGRWRPKNGARRD